MKFFFSSEAVQLKEYAEGFMNNTSFMNICYHCWLPIRAMLRNVMAYQKRINFYWRHWIMTFIKANSWLIPRVETGPTVARCTCFPKLNELLFLPFPFVKENNSLAFIDITWKCRHCEGIADFYVETWPNGAPRACFTRLSTSIPLLNKRPVYWPYWLPLKNKLN